MATKSTMTTGAFLEKMLQVEPVLVADFFISNRIVFPKKIKMDIMKNALRAYVVKTRKECLTLDSRKNYRLLWFNIFTEFQLEMLLDEVHDREDIQMDYVRKLYLKILIQMKMNSMDSLKMFVTYLEDQQKIDEGTQLTGSMINTAFRDVFYEAEDEFEGVPKDKFRAIVHNSATQENLNILANKYGITIPEKFSGDTLRDYVMQKLKNKGLLTEPLKDELLTAKISEVRKIAVENKIKNVISMNKKETIEYILERVWDDYAEPENAMVYEMSIPINPDEEKYSTLLLQYEQMGGDIQELRRELEALGGEDRLIAESKLKEKEKEFEETKAQLDDITKRFSVLEVRTGDEMDNKLYNEFDDKKAYEGLDQQTINNYETNNYSFNADHIPDDLNIGDIPTATPVDENFNDENRDIAIIEEPYEGYNNAVSIYEETKHVSELPSLIDEEDQDFMTKLKAMATSTGYSSLLMVIYFIFMILVGIGVFFILAAII